MTALNGLLFIELAIVDEDEDTFELSILELEDAFKKSDTDGEYVILTVLGSRSSADRLLKRLPKEKTLQRRVLFLGKTPYTETEIEILYVLVSVSLGYDSYTFQRLFAADIQERSAQSPSSHCFSHLIWRELRNIHIASASGDADNVNTALSKAREVFQLASSELFQAALLKASEAAQRVINLEMNFVSAQETETLGCILKASYLHDLTNNVLFGLKSAFSDKTIREMELPNVDTRLDFISAGIELRGDLKKCITVGGFPRIFLWFAVYLLRLASIFAVRKQYFVALSMSMRAFEIYCQSVLFRENRGSFDGQDNFVIDGKKSQGLGELWGICANVKGFCDDESLAKQIWWAIELRNKSLLGHGVIHPNESMFQQISSAVSKIIKNFEIGHAPPPQLWDPLRGQVNVNIFEKLERSIAANALMRLQLFYAD